MLLVCCAAVNVAYSADGTDVDKILDNALNLSGDKDLNQGFTSYPIETSGPDKNMNYNDIFRKLELDVFPQQIEPLALGSRGYRPNLIAATYGDRTPGGGFLLEYSWNRISAGFSLSYRPNTEDDFLAYQKQYFYNFYGIYHWLPFASTPYFLVGYERATHTLNSQGGIVGIGIESIIYRGLTLLLGYTYHQTVKLGFMGGGVGWAF